MVLFRVLLPKQTFAPFHSNLICLNPALPHCPKTSRRYAGCLDPKPSENARQRAGRLDPYGPSR